MSAKEVWAVIVGGMAVTYATRLSFIVFVPSDRLPELVRRGLRYAPPAVLAAIILPALLLPSGELPPVVLQPRLLAGAGAAIVAWRARNTWLTIVVGMIILWALQALGMNT